MKDIQSASSAGVKRSGLVSICVIVITRFHGDIDPQNEGET